MEPRPRYPGIEAFLAENGAKADFFVVLHEDGYETTFGDGEFHYLWSVFTSAEEADRDNDRQRENRQGAYREWGRFHVRRLSLALAEGEVQVIGFETRPHDECPVQRALQQLETRLRWGVVFTSESPHWRAAWEAPWVVKSPASYGYCYEESSVNAVLAGVGEEATIHRVAEIRDGNLGPAITREAWLAGAR